MIAGYRFLPLAEGGELPVVTVWFRGRPRSPAREVSADAAINNKGWVIANWWDENYQSHSFAWNTATNRRVRLESTTGEPVLVEDINDRGEVVGNAGSHAAIWRLREQSR